VLPALERAKRDGRRTPILLGENSTEHGSSTSGCRFAH